MHTEILRPVVVLVLWSLAMLAWLVAARMPAMKAAGIDITKITGSRPHALDGRVPDRAQWPSHNYMHLMEQPTLFYAVALVLAVSGHGGGYAALTAWGYAILRIVHSIVQATYNRIIVRLALFALSTLCLAALAVRAATVVF